jgi:hypothetical protein
MLVGSVVQFALKKSKPENFDWQVTNDDNHFVITWRLDGE